MATCKQLVFAVAGHDEETQKSMDEYTTKVIAGMRIMDEGQEGLAAFLEKGEPFILEVRSSRAEGHEGRRKRIESMVAAFEEDELV